jgi:hypothetical protein
VNLCSRCGRASTGVLCGTCALIEKVAVAIRAARNVAGVGDPSPWDRAPETSREAYRHEARAALQALGLIGAGRIHEPKEGSR